MSKSDKQFICTAVIAAVLIALAAFLRSMWRIFDTSDSIDSITGYDEAIFINLTKRGEKYGRK